MEAHTYKVEKKEKPHMLPPNIYTRQHLYFLDLLSSLLPFLNCCHSYMLQVRVTRQLFNPAIFFLLAVVDYIYCHLFNLLYLARFFFFFLFIVSVYHNFLTNLWLVFFFVTRLEPWTGDKSEWLTRQILCPLMVPSWSSFFLSLLVML
jgi:hypothetical protein